MDSRSTILELFHRCEGEFLSGEEISRSLGVSRTAVWKQIRSLREIGYHIEAVSSKGYRLLNRPDRLVGEELQAELDTSVVGKKVLCFEELDSTNVMACELAEKGEPEGTVVIADRQNAGKGRLGRRWESPAGVNLYASILLRPEIPPWNAPQLTFVSAAATAETIVHMYDLPARVKWPNDVLIGGRKVSGLLNEMSGESERLNYVVLGIGVNVNMESGQFPDELRNPATSLTIEKGTSVSRFDLTCSLLQRIDSLYSLYLTQGFDPVRQRWEACCDLVGQVVEVDQQGRVERGCVNGVDADGALLLETSAGELRVMAGDVRLLKRQ